MNAAGGGGGEEGIANGKEDEGGAKKQEDFKVDRPPIDVHVLRLDQECISTGLTQVEQSTAGLVLHQRCPGSVGSSPDTETAEDFGSGQFSRCTCIVEPGR